MSDIDIQNVLNQMRAMAAQAKGVQAPQNTAAQANGVDFGAVLKQSINNVNSTMKTSGKLQEAFQQGDQNVSLAQVMVASQKASVSFQAMTQIRNKLVDAYQEIMRMQF